MTLHSVSPKSSLDEIEQVLNRRRIERLTPQHLVEELRRLEHAFTVFWDEIEARGPATLAAIVARGARRSGRAPDAVYDELVHERQEWKVAGEILDGAKLFQFSGDQAQVLLHAGEHYRDRLEYRLPFPMLVLAFTEPVTITYGDPAAPQQEQIAALLLTTRVSTYADYEQDVQIAEELSKQGYPVEPLGLKFPSHDPDACVVSHHCVIIYADWEMRWIYWQATDHDLHETLLSGRIDADGVDLLSQARNLAVACIGFLNAENVTIERVGGADAKTNAKRAAKGKRPLEPYYIYKLHGARYDSQGREVDATGRHVSYRFDVRGHFRKLASGKVTWVRPHQRGLDHTFYVPKVYAATTQRQGEKS